MHREPVDLGICKSAVCNVPGNMPVERYDGPGMFCPTCGELLQRYEPEPGSTFAPAVAPQGAPPAAPVAPPAAQAAPPVAPKPAAVVPIPAPVAPAPPPAASPARRPLPRRAAIALSAAAAFALVAAGVSFVIADGSIRTVGVCRTSMADRFARDVVNAYVSSAHVAASHFEMRSSNCDLNFATGMALYGRNRGFAIGRDGVVAIVNPANPVRQLTASQLRGIFDGHINNWSSLGGQNAPIVAYVPQAASDESNTLSSTVMQQDTLAPTVSRFPTSTDVVRAVAAANGRNAIGIVAFSMAIPGKVLSIQPYVTPSTLSIADRRYPLTVDITVAAKTSSDPAVAGLFSFATSSGAKIVAAHNGVLP